MMRTVSWLFAVFVLAALAWASPAWARVVKIETAAPLSDHSERSVDQALKRAVETCVQRATAMDLSSIRLHDVAVLTDRVVVEMVATDTDDDADDEGEVRVLTLVPRTRPVEATDMRSAQIVRIGLGTLAAAPALASAVGPVWAQAVGAPPPSPTTPIPPPPNGEAAGGWLFFVFMVALFAIIGVGVKLYDLKRKRSDEAMHLQARIGDALLQDPALAMLPIAATARLPFWRGSPATIEVAGQLPTPALRDAAMNLVMAEASRSGVEFLVEDRMAVGSRPMARAA